MHCIDDKPNGIVLNHNSDWSGKVRIAWYSTLVREDPRSIPSTCECWCVGPDLVAGRFTPTSGPPNEPPPSVPPVDVLTRAVALAVETYLRSMLMHAVDDLFIRRDKL